MQRLDKKNRLIIPQSYFNLSDINFTRNVGVFLQWDQIFIANISHGNCKYHCIGKIRIDKSHRFVVPKLAREALKLNSSDDIMCYLSCDKIVYLKKT